MSSLRRTVRRAALIATAVGAVVLAGAVPGSAAAATTAASAASAASAAAASCPTGAFSFTSSLTGGSFRIGKNASTSGAKATACGSITALPDGTLGSVVAQHDVSFEPTTTKVLVLDLPTTVEPTSDLSGPTTLNADGTIGVSLAGSVLVTTSVLGSTCTFPLDLNLTTGTSGSLTGTPLAADGAGGFAGKLVAGDFTVPRLKASKRCNVVVSSLTNTLLGLPLAAGRSSITFDLSLKLGS